MSADALVPHRTARNAARRGRLSAPAVATAVALALVAVAATALIWLVAVPVGPEVCALSMPAPRNCFAHDRIVAAATATPVLAVIALALAAAVIATETEYVDRRARNLARAAAPALLIVVATGAVISTAWIPALAWSTTL